MKAIVQRGYGPPLEVLELHDIDVPDIADDQVLIRVHAAGVNALDWHLVTGVPYIVRMSEGLRGPKSPVPGRDVAGTVEAVGRNVTRFQPGNEVFGWNPGTFAEYVATKEKNLVSKPSGVTFEQAAAVPVAAITALQGLRDQGGLEAGQHVLITGASRGVGTFAVQLAKTLGAEVTAVSSTRNAEMVRSIGADHVIDYTRRDFPEDRRRYDLILDIAGQPSLSGCRRSLTEGGTLVLVGGEGGRWLGPLPRIAAATVLVRRGQRRARFFVSVENQEDLLLLAELLASGRIAPVIDRAYDLNEAPEAVRYLEAGHTQGKVVIGI